MKFLLVEDDVALATVVRRALSESGHVVDIESDGDEAFQIARAGRYDALILDVMLPGRAGTAVARSLRTAGIHTPILMLTARDTVNDIVEGLDAGADDYLCKPFVFVELEARLRSITRRKAPDTARHLECGDLVMDLASRTVRRGVETIALSARETAFLEFFMRHRGQLITRAMLEDALWEHDRDTTSNIIEVYVRRLRRKLEREGETLFETVRGSGYRFGTGSG